MIHGKLSYGEVKDRQGVVQPYTTIIAEDIIFFQWKFTKFLGFDIV